MSRSIFVVPKCAIILASWVSIRNRVRFGEASTQWFKRSSSRVRFSENANAKSTNYKQSCPPRIRESETYTLDADIKRPRKACVGIFFHAPCALDLTNSLLITSYIRCHPFSASLLLRLFSSTHVLSEQHERATTQSELNRTNAKAHPTLTQPDGAQRDWNHVSASEKSALRKSGCLLSHSGSRHGHTVSAMCTGETQASPPYFPLSSAVHNLSAVLPRSAMQEL